MKKLSNLKVGLTVLSLSVVGIALWYGNGDTAIEHTTSNHNNKQDKQAPQAIEQQQKKAQLPGTTITEQGLDFAPEMKERLQTISEAYEEKIRFPSYSQPIKPEELERKYLPDIPIATALPARLSDPDSPTLAIKPNKMRYFTGDIIEATASISGINNSESSAVMAQLKANGVVVAQATSSPNDQAPHSYKLVFDQLNTEHFSSHQELTLETEFQFQGQRYQRGASIEYINTIASIVEVATSAVDGAFLSIPVYISTEKPGYHRLRANLYDAESNTPLVHLRAEEMVNDTVGTLTLKAHISALKESGSEGPYTLGDLSLQRLPSAPDYTTEFGRVDENNVHIEGYSFSEYNDEPYINEKAQRIAKELRRLGS